MQSMRSIKLFLFSIIKPNRYAQMSDNLEDVSTESAGIEVISIIHQTNTTDWMMNGIEGWVRRFDSIRWEGQDGQSDISTASRPIRFDLSVSSSTGTFHFISFRNIQKRKVKEEQDGDTSVWIYGRQLVTQPCPIKGWPSPQQFATSCRCPSAPWGRGDCACALVTRSPQSNPIQSSPPFWK